MATFKKIGKKGQEKWSVVFDIPGYVPRKQKRLSGYKSRSEANLAHIAFLANYKTSIDARQSSNTESFDSLYCSYINYVKNSVKEASYLSIGSAFKNHILPYFKDKDMREILPKNISEWILWIDKRTDLSDKGYRKLGYKSKIKVRGFLSRFFLFCIDNGVLSNNPCDKAFRIKKTETEAHLEKEMSIWDESEFAQFISVVDDLMYKTLFSFLYLSGCRRGEALALTWKDLSGNTVRIRKSISFQSIEGGYRITTPKNKYSIRDVVLPNSLIELLNKLRCACEQKELFKEENFVFGGTRVLPQNNVRRKLEYYCKLANVNLIRIHDFRHSHASLLISKGYDIVVIARRLGHADIKMTLNQYAHIMPNKQNELLSGLNINL